MATARPMLPFLFPRLCSASRHHMSATARRCCQTTGAATSTTSTASFSTSRLSRAPPTPPLASEAHASTSATQSTTAREPPPSPRSAWTDSPRSAYPPPSHPTQQAGPVPSPPGPSSSSSASVQAERESATEACASLSPSSPSAPRSQRPSLATLAAGSQPSVSQAAGASQTAKGGESSVLKVASAATATASSSPSAPSTSPNPQRKSTRNFRSQKAAISLTPSAVDRLQTLLDSPSGPRLIRIGVRNKGCAGMSYHLEYVEPSAAGKFDERVRQDGVEVLVDSKALFSIIGSEMDWKEDRLSAKFVFNNPNIKEACGCGESFLT